MFLQWHSQIAKILPKKQKLCRYIKNCIIHSFYIRITWKSLSPNRASSQTTQPNCTKFSFFSFLWFIFLILCPLCIRRDTFKAQVILKKIYPVGHVWRPTELIYRNLAVIPWKRHNIVLRNPNFVLNHLRMKRRRNNLFGKFVPWAKIKISSARPKVAENSFWPFQDPQLNKKS